MKSRSIKMMLQLFRVSAAAIVVSLFVLDAAIAQNKLTEPVYRVANETPAAQPAAVAPAAAPAAVPAVPAANAAKVKHNFAQQTGEHPLAPLLRALKTSQEELDRNIRDYSCTFSKRERVNGQLGDYQLIFLKVMHQPFSVYMNFQQPFAGREVVYVEGQNDGKLVALDVGFTRVLGKISLDPTGPRAMNGQKRPITDVGIKNLNKKLTDMWTRESQFGECEVSVKPGTKVEGRTATMVQIVHPVPRQNFKFHAARVFFDDELGIPIHFDAYLWPAQGAQPELEESYTYAKNLKVNNNFTALDFDHANNPNIFKK
jgi:Protein of unknown function (DUF1571)